MARMALKAQALALVLPLLLAAALAYDVAEKLEDFEEYSTFVGFLTAAQIAEKITDLPKATILIVENSAAGPLSSLPPDKVKEILSLHVILDYYCNYGLEELPGWTKLVPTLSHDINATVTGKEEYTFGDGVAGAPLTSKVIKTAGLKPPNFCIMEISALIMPYAAGASPAKSALPRFRGG